METLLSSRKLYGAFSFPFKWAHWLGLDNMGMVILWFMLPTFIAAFGFPALFTSSASNYHFFFSVTMSLFFLCSVAVFWWFYSFLPHFLGGRSNLRPSFNHTHTHTKKNSLKICSCSTAVLSNPEAAWGKFWEALPPALCPGELPSCAVLQRRQEHICPLECQEPEQDGWVTSLLPLPRPIACSRSIPGCGEVWVRILALFVVWLCSGHISLQFIQLPCFVFLDVVVRT